MRRRAHVGIGLVAATLAAGCASAPQVTATVAAAEEGPVICREMLVYGSNVIDELCLTEEGWKDFERRRRQNAQAALMRMQGMSGAGF